MIINRKCPNFIFFIAEIFSFSYFFFICNYLKKNLYKYNLGLALHVSQTAQLYEVSYPPKSVQNTDLEIIWVQCIRLCVDVKCKQRNYILRLFVYFFGIIFFCIAFSTSKTKHAFQGIKQHKSTITKNLNDLRE